MASLHATLAVFGGIGRMDRGWTIGRFAAVLAVCTATIAPPRAQGQKADADYARKAYDAYQSMRGSSPYAAIPWQYLGPTNISGRATDIAVADRRKARRIYVGYATSGVWKTDDNGQTWQSIFDDYATSSIGDIAVAPSNPDIVWIGTGEANLFRASMPGVGLYKSTNAGRTFAHSGLTDTQTIARIVVHPTNPDIVYVAASGHGWTENEMRGVFKTADGGRNWEKVLYRGPGVGAIDLVMDPSDSNSLYAATWQRTRRKWSDPRVEPGSTESAIWKTTDAGRTWHPIVAGLPNAQFRGRIGIAIARSNPRVLYAFIDNYEPGRPAKEGERDAYGRPVSDRRIKAAEIYRTDNKGKSWRKVSDTNDYMANHSGSYGWVFGQIRVDPGDENTIYSLGLNLNVSHDGGKTFSQLRGMHGDHHGLWIDPHEPSTLYNANDGGFYSSQDSGKTWKFAVSAGGAQFYNVTLDNSTPVWAYGSVQDHGSRRGQVDLSAGRDRIPAQEWVTAPGGEGSFQAIDPANADVVFSHGFYGNFTRTNQAEVEAAPGRGGEGGASAGNGRGGARAGVTTIRPTAADGESDLRAQWMAPIIASIHQPGTIYAGYQFVYRSTTRGDSWERISPDLTSNNESQMLLRSSNAVPYQTITALAESPRKKGMLYAGTDDGKLHVTMDDGTTWTELTAAVPTQKWYSRVVASRHDDDIVYVTQRGREDDDFGVYVYKSMDRGKTFVSLAANIPAGSVNGIAEDARTPNTLYLGTDFGAFISTDGGGRWEVLGANLPSVQVSDLAYHARDDVLVIATYGRGMYAIDALALRPGDANRR
jgi:photosystem II stability/assembly factor-like uncharacterized protein